MERCPRLSLLDQYKDKVPTNAKKCRSVRVVTKWSATKCLRRVSYREIIATARGGVGVGRDLPSLRCSANVLNIYNPKQ